MRVDSHQVDATSPYPAAHRRRQGDITHGWITTTADGTEINFNTGPSYGEAGHVVGSVDVLAAAANACRHQVGGGEG